MNHEEVSITKIDNMEIEPVNEITIAYINSLPQKDLKFSHFADLRVGGKDQFSHLSYDEMECWIPDYEKTSLKIIKFKNKKDRTNMLRWFFRGLTEENAIRKVKIDNYIKNNWR